MVDAISQSLGSSRVSNFFLLLVVLLWNASLSSSFCPPLCACNDNSLSVDCHEANNLRMVPIFFNPQTKFLSLASNQIEDISMSFQFYSELQRLDFSQNKIVSIGQNNFENLKNLLKLNASFNGINQLEPDVFLGLSQTLVLDLSANHLEKVDTRVFRGMTSLRELYLDRNRLDALDWDLFQGLERLETLSAKYNFLRVLQPPGSLASGLPAASPTAAWTLKNVRRLDMSWNQITRVKDHGLSIFNGLLDLNLCCNYIHTVEERAFVPYPAGFLKKLNLSQNRLSRVPTESLEKLGSSLQELDMSSNRISEQIPSHAFRSLFQLRVLRLSDNPGIPSIDPDALIDNINLAEFEADHLSNLTELQVGLFNNKPFLKSFSIRFAQVSIVPPELFQSQQYSGLVTALRLVGNPLDCNCSSLILFQYISQRSMTSASSSQVKSLPQNKSSLLHQHQIHDDLSDPFLTSLGHVQCASPPHLQGALLQDLKRSDFEHCFEKVFFASEHFEILVIGIGAVIVVTIVTLIGVKLCCVHGLCRRKNSCCGGCKSKDEKDKALDDFCCRSGVGVGVRNGTLARARDCERTEYPTIVAAKKVLNVNLDEFRVPISRGGRNFGTLYSNGSSNCNSRSNNSNSTSTTNGHSSAVPATAATTMTLTSGSGGGSQSPLDLDGYLRLHSTATTNCTGGKNSSNNKLRFDPKMQMQMHFMESAGDVLQLQHNSSTKNRHHHTNHPHPPMILHYEYDYPDYRSMHRVKQVPSVLV